jgi:hypothetical protein
MNLKTVFAPGSGKKGEFRTFASVCNPTGKTGEKRGEKNKTELKDSSDCMGI